MEDMKNSSLFAAVFHRFISQPASSRSSALLSLATFLVLSFFDGLCGYTVYFSDPSFDEEILNLYVIRWNIEVYFRNCKSKLAIDQYQIRSAKGIKRLWVIASLVYLLACLESERFCFSDGFRFISCILYREQVSFIFDYAANGGDKSALLQKIA